MEQITRRDGIYYYGDERCAGVEQVYERFREDYHSSVGRKAFQRLDRIGQRTERIHGFGYCFADERGGDEFRRYGKVRYRMGGLVGISYSRILGLYDYAHIPDDEFEAWLDWAFTRGRGVLRLVGRRKNTGRTSKRLKTRYR